jgi:hypothetical protein
VQPVTALKTPSPPNYALEVAERLLENERELIKNYKPHVKTKADARKAVLDAIDALKLSGDEDEEYIYKQARGYMNSVIDNRAAAEAGF